MGTMKVWIHKCENVNGSVIEFFHKYEGIPRFSHYSMSYISDSGNKLFFDSTNKNISLYHVNEFKKKYRVVGEDHCFNVDKFRFMNWMENKLGKKYPKLELFGMLLKKIGLFSYNPFQNRETFLCNELVLDFVYDFFNPITKDYDLDLIETDKIIEREETCQYQD